MFLKIFSNLPRKKPRIAFYSNPFKLLFMGINNWIETERPREKLLAKGAAALSDAELLAILLRVGKKGKTAVDLARDLLQAFGGLRNLFEIDQKTLCDYPGIGIAKYTQLQAALELARRRLYQNLAQKDVIDNSTDTKEYLIAQLRHHKQEVFACLFLDSQHHIICYEELFHGTIDNSTIYPREVLKKVLNYNATAVIFAHNHPSGIATPSDADRDITQHLKIALNMIDVSVLDHIIVGDGCTTSFAEHGWV